MRQPLWKRHLYDKAKRTLFRPLRCSRPWAFVQAFLVGLVCFWFRVPTYVPSAEITVVLIGLVVAFMTIRADEQWSRGERIVWLCLVIAFSAFAIQSIKRNEREVSRERAVQQGKLQALNDKAT